MYVHIAVCLMLDIQFSSMRSSWVFMFTSEVQNDAKDNHDSTASGNQTWQLEIHWKWWFQ